jgi:flagellin-like protein
MKGVSAVIATILMLMITVAMAGMAYMYIQGMFKTGTQAISLLDAYCITGGNATFHIRNDGTDNLSPAALTVVKINVGSSCADMVNNSKIINAGSSILYFAQNCDVGRSHTWRMRGPSNAIELTVYCSS